MLKQILSISGKPGLYRLISRGQNMLIVESLIDGKRLPAYTRDRLVSLNDITMFTTSDDLPLHEVLQRLGVKYEWKAIELDAKKADNDTLRSFFGEVVEDFDRDRVYPSDIRKLISWYNILIAAGFTDFTPQQEEEEENKSAKAEVKQEEKKEQKKAATQQVKTQKAAAKASAKTGVGAKKG
ncbi:MAG: DUF5606 domain-containing protein [Paludibacteraceae bacterium]|nr:DUF5606 domain-containing protein [Paludibacteraceae bacterium]